MLGQEFADPASTMSDASVDLEMDAVMDLLGNARRRRIIYLLDKWGGEADLDDLAASIAATEQGVAPESVTQDDRRRVYISLYQNHLPKLDSHGIVEYDRDERRAHLTDRAVEILDAIPAGNPRSVRRVVGLLVLIQAATLLLVLGGAGGVVALPVAPLVIAVVGLVVALLVAGAQYLHAVRATGESRFSWLVE